MTLNNVKKGQICRIVSISDEPTRVQAIRFGFTEGSTVTCAESIPAGPIILRKNRQEIAVGRGLAGKITVTMNI